MKYTVYILLLVFCILTSCRNQQDKATIQQLNEKTAELQASLDSVKNKERNKTYPDTSVMLHPDMTLSQTSHDTTGSGKLGELLIEHLQEVNYEMEHGHPMPKFTYVLIYFTQDGLSRCYLSGIQESSGWTEDDYYRYLDHCQGYVENIVLSGSNSGRVTGRVKRTLGSYAEASQALEFEKRQW